MNKTTTTTLLRRTVPSLVAAAVLAAATGSAVPSAPASSTAAAPQAAAGDCAPALVDDYASGSYRSPDLTTGTIDNYAPGTMLGGVRRTRFRVANNPYQFPSTLLVAPPEVATLVVSSGFKGSTVLQIHYGLPAPGSVKPLNADLSCYGRFQVRFTAVDLPLNVNVQVKSASSPSVYQCGLNTAAHTNGFVANFPFDCFVTNDPAHPPVDWTDIDRVALLIQSGSAVAANDYAIRTFKLTR